jgi:hypothetical protein
MCVLNLCGLDSNDVHDMYDDEDDIIIIMSDLPAFVSGKYKTKKKFF